MGSTHCRCLAVILVLIVAVLDSSFRRTAALTISSDRQGRKLLQTDNISTPSSQSDDTVRIDPLDHFKKYRGGFDITNKHYWSSIIFTGISGYAIGVLWLLCGIAYGGFLVTTKCCNRYRKGTKLKNISPCTKQCAFWRLFVAVCFTILAVTASGAALGGAARFHSRAKTVLNIIIDTADRASETLYSTTGAMEGIRGNLVSSNLGLEASTFLTSTSQELDTEAANIQKQARKNRRLIHNILKIVYLVTTVAISLNLCALIAVSVFGYPRQRQAFYWLILLCWLLTVLCWLFFGVYFFLERFAGDTCAALHNFQQNPYNNTLSSILPCDELLSAEPILSDVSVGIYDLVNEVNANIAGLQTTSYTSLRVCNPFSGPPEYQYQSGSCPVNTIRIGDIPQVLKLFTCSNNNDGTCREGEFISVNDFRMVEKFTSSLQNLLSAYPEMQSLVNCELVKNAFSEILLKHCKPLKRYVRMVWIPIIFLAVMMVMLVLIWLAKDGQEQKHPFSNDSVKPEFTIAKKVQATINSSNSSLGSSKALQQSTP